MDRLKLYIGDKHLSSWSMRPWLLMKHFEIPFEENLIHLDQADSKDKIAGVSPSSLVPVLVDKDLKIWDSLAICEYLVEKFPKINLWPESLKQRALARSVCAEMHSGFSALRKECPMNLTTIEKEKKQLSIEAQKNISRIDALWSQCREASKAQGDFLFGEFCIADAFFMPVVSRIRTYNLVLNLEHSKKYYSHVMATPLFKMWLEVAQ